TSLRFLEAHAHIAIVGPVGVGKTFLGHALGHIAARRRYSVLAETVDHLLETLRHARLDHSHETELRKRLAVDLLLIDDFGIEAMTPEGEPRHLHAHDRAPSPRLHDRHLEPRSRRVAGHLR